MSGLSAPGTAAAGRPWTRFLDAHLHVIDPAYRITADNGYTPAPFTIADHRIEPARA